jgi:O-antigen/teichoic acid export membrane protein
VSTATEPSTGEVGKSAGKVGVAILVGSALGYAVTVTVGRLLSPGEFTVFITFWGIAFGLGSALSPIEQEVGRLSALAALGKGKAGMDTVRSFAVGAAAAAVAGLVLLIPGVNERLFTGHYGLGPVILVAGIAFAAQFAVRGLLVGRHQVTPYSWLIVVEAAIRPLLIGLLVVFGLVGMVPLAVAVGVGSFAWLVFLGRASGMIDRGLPGEPWGPVIRRVLVLMLGAALTASVITGYPAMVRLLAPGGDEGRLGALFAALTIARVPLLMFAAVQALAVPVVVRLSSSVDGLRTLRRMLALGTVGALVLAAVGALAGLLVGPWLVRLLYGADYQVDGAAVAGLVWSSVLLATVQLLAAVLVARKQANLVLAVWAVVAVAGALVLALWPGETVLRATLGLVIGPTAGLVIAVSLVLRPRTNVAADTR